MKKLLTFLFLCLTGISSSAFGQGRITGTVVDAKDQPVIGATAAVEGTTLGATTDRDGNFALNNVPATGTLLISFIGYESQSIPINNRTTFRIVLQESVQQIEELIVIGYGAAKKSDLTGSVARIGSEQLQLTSSADPMQSLQGRVAGVAVLSNNKPGSAPNMRIRGTGSIDANNEPLYVVDGFPLMGSSVTDLNSNDIESIEILKDASSAAIYGSRGANGVILITTKGGGAKNRNSLNVSSYIGIQSPARLVDALGRDEFIEYINEAYKDQGGIFTSSNPAPNNDTDWQKEIIRSSAIVQDYAVSFDGGTAKTSYLFSGGYYNQEGLIPTSGYEKYSGRLKLNHEFNRWLKVGANVQYTDSKQDLYDNATGDIFRFGWPTMPVKNADGSWYLPSNDPQHASYVEGAAWNPVWSAATSENYRKTNRVLADVFAEVKLTENLTFRTNFGIDVVNGRSYNYESLKSPGSVQSQTPTDPVGRGGRGGQGSTKAFSKLSESMLTYANTWDKHRFTATGVYSFQEYTYESMSLSGQGFQNDATGAWNMALADKESVAYSTDKYGNRLISFTARGAYAYDDKYLLTVTGRYDGSSRFGENNKWGFFPSIGVGWRVSEEDFLRNSQAVSNLKVRFSYGQTGNQEIGNYKSLAQLEVDNHIFEDKYLQGLRETLGNSDLKWERTHQYDIGIDLGLWNRVELTVDYYQRVTNDLLYNVPIPSTSGFSSILSNVGEVKNNGLEVGINARVIDRDFKWDVSGNFSYNKNEITELYGGVDVVNIRNSSIGLWQQLMVGKPVNSIWARESAGLIRNQEQLTAYRVINPAAQLGDEMYVDHVKDNSISTEDYIFLGSVEPKYHYGISMDFFYKNFSLNLHGQGAFDYASLAGADDNTFNQSGAGSSISIGYSNLSNYLLYGENQLRDQRYIPSKYAYDRMYHETRNPNGSFPRAGASNTYLSDRTNGNWNYFILRNVKLSYDFSSLIKVKGIEGVTVYVNAQNYFSIAKKHRGYNPENGDTSHPWAKIMMFGFSARF